jgi:hypothetical protein
MKPQALFVPAILCLVSSARAQLHLDWYTIDGGGGTSSGGSISITGTIGQHDPSTSAGGSTECTGGFWTAFAGASGGCYANCDASTSSPILTANDFVCFLTRFVQQDPYANCDNSTTAPILNANDFVCFLNSFVTGCP